MEDDYSGLGLNPHYGTPRTVIYVECIVDGSSSGAQDQDQRVLWAAVVVAQLLIEESLHSGS